MNSEARIALPPEEQARRRKVVAQARWSAKMEGLGDPLPERLVLDELWITGQISREERRARLHAMLEARDARV
jgi:hypothetical protein